jgi:Zn-dependent metalloprotease
VTVAVLAASALVAPPATAAPPRAPAPVNPAAAADRLVNSPAAGAALRRGPGDTLRRGATIAGTRGLRYVTYDRTYQGLPVLGGDVVVTTDATGAVRGTAVAQEAVIKAGTTAKVTAEAAAATARRQLPTVEGAGTPRLVVLAWSGEPKLVWETVVTGRAAGNRPSKLHVFVDATSGAVAETTDEVKEGTGTGYYNGPVSLDTSGSGSSYSLTDTTRPGLKCGGQNGAAFTGTDDEWGDGAGTSLETACVDAMYAAQRQSDMLREWFGRDGFNGTGGAVPIRVGLNSVNAYWDGNLVNFGHNRANDRQVTPIDVVGHELGHALFQFTPGGAGGGNENGGINEATGDIFGALTEAYANNPNDPPDYSVGEEVDLVGSGPIRYMHDPSLAGDPNCWSTAIPATEVHAAAGPLNHWFYLAAEGSAPVGKPASPTCDGSTVTGLGIRKAGEIYYNALLTKTSTWKHANIRVATLHAAKNLHPTSCAEFRAVKAAWTAISVPAQPGEPTCNVSGNDFSLSLTPTSGTVDAGSAATVTVDTAVTVGSAEPVALSASGLPYGATASFDPTPVTAGAAAQLTISTAPSTPSGTFPITVTGVGPDTRTATYSLTVIGAPGCSGSNATRVAIPDNGPPVTSDIAINGCGRNASAASSVQVDITHPYRGDLILDLVAPDGSAYRLKAKDGDSGDDIRTTYAVNVAGEPADGTWQLRVQDAAGSDVGALNSWTLTV